MSDLLIVLAWVSRATIWEPGASGGPVVVGNRSLYWESLGQLRASRLEASWLGNRLEARRHWCCQETSPFESLVEANPLGNRQEANRLGDRLEQSWLGGWDAYKLLASLVRSKSHTDDELFNRGFLAISFYCLRVAFWLNPLFRSPYNKMRVSMKKSFLQINVCWVHFIVCPFCCSLCP